MKITHLHSTYEEQVELTANVLGGLHSPHSVVRTRRSRSDQYKTPSNGCDTVQHTKV